MSGLTSASGAVISTGVIGTQVVHAVSTHPTATHVPTAQVAATHVSAVRGAAGSVAGATQQVLPFTGVAVGAYLVIALALVVVGMLLTLLSRGRRSA